MATLPVFLPGESPWAGEPGGLQSMRLERGARLKHLSMHAYNNLHHMIIKGYLRDDFSGNTSV